MPRFIELQAALPRVAKPIGPLSWVTIALVPDVFLRPQPALLPECENQFKDVDMAFAVLRFFFDVQDESTSRLQYAVKLFSSG